MAINLKREGTVAGPDLPEPYAALLAFLDDLHEQIGIYRAGVGDDPLIVGVLDELERRIEGLALLLSLHRA